MTQIQKTNCEKCLKDLHDECKNPDNCLCAENEHGEPLFKPSDEVMKLFTLKNLKKSAREITLTETDEIKTHTDCGEFIMSKYQFKTLKDTEEILFYLVGVWCEGGKFLIGELCQEIINECKNTFVNEVMGVIKRSTGINRDELNNNLSKFVLEKSVLDVDTLLETEHNPELLSTVKLPIIYDSKARCPKFIKFLKSCFQKDEKEYYYEDMITVLEEIANVLTTNRIHFDVFALWIGNASNGKSTMIKIINGVFGPENCSNVSIHDIEDQRFSVSRLYGKLVNHHADISNKELDNLGKTKQLVSGDPIDVEKKNKDPFSLINFAKLFFSANETPIIKDDSDGIFRRIIPTTWPNQFLPGAGQIKDFDKIILEEEKSGIFNLILHNYHRLLKNDGFSYPQSIAKVRYKIKLEADKLLEFVETCLIPDPNEFFITERLFEIYQKYSNLKKYTIFSQQKLGQRLPRYGIHKADQRKIKGHTKRGWKVRLNKDAEWIKNNVRGLDEFS